jgi:hypothetical protein
VYELDTAKGSSSTRKPFPFANPELRRISRAANRNYHDDLMDIMVDVLSYCMTLLPCARSMSHCRPLGLAQGRDRHSGVEGPSALRTTTRTRSGLDFNCSSIVPL